MERLTKNELKAIRKAERQQSEAREAQMTKVKRYGFWAGVAVLLLASIGVIYLITRPVHISPLAEEATATLPPLSATDYRTGPKNAKVTFLEYGDFQCPACGYYFPIVEQLRKDYKDQVQFVFRDFPLMSVHQNAMIAAQAAYAAGLQNKFWEMHDLLYQNQTKWADQKDPTPLFLEYAKKLGLNTDTFTADMNTDAAKKFVNAEEAGGEKAGINSTPSFFINGHLLQNPQDVQGFKTVIDEELRSGH